MTRSRWERWAALGGFAFVAGYAGAFALRFGLLPRWFAWLGFIAGALLPLAIAFIGYLVFALWVLVTSTALVWQRAPADA